MDDDGKTASVKKLSECLRRINRLGINLTDLTGEMVKYLPEELTLDTLGKSASLSLLIDNDITELTACIDESRRLGINLTDLTVEMLKYLPEESS